MLLNAVFLYPANRQDRSSHCEANLKSGKRHAVNPIRLILISGPGILRQNFQKSLPAALRKPL